MLRLENDSDTICVEGIEDVDINDDKNIILHQCKCYEGTEYTHSKIKDALVWMLKHFSENKDSEYKYYLYGVYKSGQHKLPQIINVEFAKKTFFTTNHRNASKDYLYQQLNLSDDDISLFLQRLIININAVGLEMQEKIVREELCKALDCKIQQVEPYYCNALAIIRRLATQKHCSDRTISRSKFIQEVKNVDNQFDMWLLHKNGVERFAKAIKKKYFTTFNISPYDRFFIIECDKHTSISELKTIVIRISEKYSNLSQRAKPKFCPYFCFQGIEECQLIELKRSLANDSVLFFDGYDFRGADFNPSSVVKEPSKDHLIKLRIIDSTDLLDAVFERSQLIIEIYQFYKNQTVCINENYHHVKIPYERITDIAQMI